MCDRYRLPFMQQFHGQSSVQYYEVSDRELTSYIDKAFVKLQNNDTYNGPLAGGGCAGCARTPSPKSQKGPPDEIVK